MELAIPLMALGSLYIVSNQDSNNKSKNKEQFTSKLPNLDVPDRNFPPTANGYVSESDVTQKLSVDNRYNGPSAYTDKYFRQLPTAEEPTNNNIQFQSLTGQTVDSSYFKHNNMVPFFGSKIRGSVDPNNNESIMENYLGTGATQIVKSEQSPLFNPNEKLQYPHGAPNMNDFYQSRVNPSLKMNGVKPFQETRVGPGLGLGADQIAGQGGYNSGMASRESWLPKTVDDLRTANKQKATDTMLLGHEGPGKARITNVGILGAFQKNRPETAFEWGPERYFTTTGVGIAPTSHAIPVERYVNRADTSVEYEGVASVAQGTSKPLDPGTILQSHRTEHGPTQLGVANAGGRQFATEGDFGAKSKQVYMNNRAYNHGGDDYFGAVKSGIGAVVAPLLEVLRPSRKENVVGNMRVYGDAKPAVTQGYLYNPNDAPAPTMRETTEESIGHLNVNRGQTNNGYLATPYQTTAQERDTSSVSYIGGAGYSNSALRPYNAELSYVPSDLKNITAKGRTGNGNTNMFNNSVNYNGKAKDADNFAVANRDLMPRLPSQTRSLHTFGEFQPKSQGGVSSIAMDRNTPDINSVLQQNPYAIRRTYAAS